MKLTLIRHGITEGNLKRLYYGSTDLPITDEGREALEKLSSELDYPGAARYFTSGMLRAEQSFKAIYGDIPHEALPGIREVDFGDFEMKTYDELLDDPAYQCWISGDNEANLCPGGESGNIATERALSALAPLIESGEDAVCVTHGGIIGGVMIRWFPGEGGRYRFTPLPGHGFTVEFADGRPVSYREVP